MKRIDSPIKRAALVVAVAAFALCYGKVIDDFGEIFLAPPSAATVAIWWFWGEPVITNHGVTQDIEMLKRAGYGGVVDYKQVFTVRPDALKRHSPEWLARFRFAAAECTRLDLTLEVDSGNGFVAGGPRITQELGMQRLIASETIVDGGVDGGLSLPKPQTRYAFYRDVAVVGYPAPAGADGATERRCSLTRFLESL